MEPISPAPDAAAAYDAIIVGAGHAGAQAAIALRQRGFAGSILLLGEEAELPYERPPLSKDYLSADKAFDRMLIRPPAFWQDKAVELRCGVRAVAVHADARQLTLSDGAVLHYGKLVWAAGGTARRLNVPGADLPQVLTLRNRADADALRALLHRGARRFVVVGGGYIGLEAAAALVKAGATVTVLEMQERLLARVCGPALASFFAAQHRAHGVDVRLEHSVAAITGTTHVEGVILADGTQLSAEAVVVGVGIDANVDALLAAGARACAGGVEVDSHCRTSLPDVYAVGDCAAFPCAWADGAVLRVESVQNATDQASHVARLLCGETSGDYAAFPWFWSNQYDLKLQTAGLMAGYDREVVRGVPDAQGFSILYFRGRRLLAIDAVNAVRDYVQARKLIEARAEIDPDRAADPAIALKDLAPATTGDA